jgi:hypothetical protein
MSNVHILKMINGEEVIADVVDLTSTDIIVDRPRVINITQDQHGQMQGGLMPYIISDPERKNIPLSRNSVTTAFPASKELSDSYLQMTSGLILG